MMKIPRWLVIPALTAMMLVPSNAALGNPQVVTISPNFQPDPQVLNSNTSVGSTSISCSNLTSEPSVVLDLTQDMSSLNFIVQSSGQPVLKIEGPNGSACVAADGFSDGKVKIPGYWQQGSYSIYIGDRADGNQNYTLSISSQ